MEVKNIHSLSLGQGMGPRAEKLIREAKSRGGWVLLQNCHLGQSWMPDLERIVEDFQETDNKEFRLWLTSMPSSYFPISVLQNGIKMTMEPPQGIQANLSRSYQTLSDSSLNDCAKPKEYQKLMYALCFFHAIIQDRVKFGPIGWNIAYKFTGEDLDVSQKQLKMLLDDYDQVPYKVLNILVAEINYGGRVTDDKDVKLIKHILEIYINEDVLTDEYKFSESGIYLSPPTGSYAGYVSTINQLPKNPAPEIFGLHDNAEIVNNQNQSRILLETCLLVEAQSGGSSSNTDYEHMIAYIQKNTPEAFDYASVQKKFPTDYNESMNTVLCQEILRYNVLLVRMKKDLVDLLRALKGFVVMSEELESIYVSLLKNEVPKIWSDTFLSLKPLATWVIDLNDRVQFLKNWVQNGTPLVFWISGFSFPQAFITGTLQNIARKMKLAIDLLSFEHVLQEQQPEDIKEKIEDGAMIYGCFIEGAKWNAEKKSLDISVNKELFSNLPMIKLKAVQERQECENVYQCPLYRVISRAGTLMTTGHSTNFVLYLDLPSPLFDKKKWVVAGVASFLALR